MVLPWVGGGGRLPRGLRKERTGEGRGTGNRNRKRPPERTLVRMGGPQSGGTHMLPSLFPPPRALEPHDKEALYMVGSS